ncbi:hypothetical protein OCU04_005789 [Sclerotinia nivalis]|uniref:Uncharacterized protein n=1 Tax=Sclerotinia nivalis TaxID=352851 RepID=A0A9X0ALN7_9HELO|nr:hypothetical protein OCU04_005789 [Sclerotinia nivalis]
MNEILAETSKVYIAVFQAFEGDIGHSRPDPTSFTTLNCLNGNLKNNIAAIFQDIHRAYFPKAGTPAVHIKSQ